jgi:hypothetical protein
MVLLSRIRRPPKIHLAKSVIIAQPELQVAITNNNPNRDKHHSRGLLHKVSKSSKSFALRLDKHHHRQPHHTLALYPFHHLLIHTSRTPRNHHKNPSSSNQ